MLELLGLLGGAVARLLPSILTFFKEGRDLKYELLRMEKEAELEKLRGANRLAEIAAIADSKVDEAWANGLVEGIKNQTQVTGDKWLDRINVSVRPFLTYWWCVILYSSYKGILMVEGARAGLPLADFAAVLYTEFDRAVVGSIVSYWFMDRTLRQLRK